MLRVREEEEEKKKRLHTSRNFDVNASLSDLLAPDLDLFSASANKEFLASFESLE